MRLRLAALFITIICLFTTCNLTTPEQYFDRTVLNTNMIAGFAEEGFYKELELPSQKLNEATNKAEPMKRSEVVAQKIAWTEKCLNDVASLKPTEETKQMIEVSTALYSYILPVYKKEYMQLAKLFDEGAPESQLLALAGDIYDRHYQRSDKLYNRLVAAGKPYAAKHNIKVDWGK